MWLPVLVSMQTLQLVQTGQPIQSISSLTSLKSIFAQNTLLTLSGSNTLSGGKISEQTSKWTNIMLPTNQVGKVIDFEVLKDDSLLVTLGVSPDGESIVSVFGITWNQQSLPQLVP